MKKLLVFAVISVVVYGGWRWRHHDEPAQADKPSLAFDRIWVDHMPKSERDTINVFAALHGDGIGIFQATSVWKGAFEIFQFEAHEGEMRVIYPQNGDKEKVRLKARECHEKDMDFCLEVEGSSRGVKRYYSREGWEIGNLDVEHIDAVVRAAAE